MMNKSCNDDIEECLEKINTWRNQIEELHQLIRAERIKIERLEQQNEGETSE